MKAYFMKMKSLAVALAGILIMGTLWGCGNTQSAKAVPESGESLTASTAENDENGSSADSSSRSLAETAGETKASYYTDWDDVREINILLMDSAKGTTQEMKSRVEEGINEITENEIKVHVNLEYINMG